MKLWIMSDLHFEFHRDGGAAFLESLPDVDHDVAVIAGDLCSFPMIGESLRRCSERFKRVVYVIGNHECYGTTIKHAVDVAAEAAHKLANVDHLELESVRIDGQRFVGTSLWFPYPGPTRADLGMNDFWHIRHLRDDVDGWNKDAVTFLENVRETDVVITHHLPSTASVAGKYADSPLNAFFVGGAAHIIERRQPRLWIHGHTHESVDVGVRGTRIVCNPYGYAGSEVNPNFSAEKIVDLPAAREAA